MKPIVASLCLVVSCGLSGCRQSDATMPPVVGDVPNRLEDIGRDLSNAAGGDQQAPQELADDLALFVRTPEADAAARDLARQVATTLSGAKLTDDATRQLASHLWVTVAAPDLSDRQVETLQSDVKGTLVSVGIADPNAQRISDQVGAVQKVVNTRGRRWYEFF
jgi:hypothetical protein